MEDFQYQYFRPQRSAKNVIIFLITFGLFAAGGLVLYLFTRQIAGLIMGGLCVLALIGMTFKILAAGTRYGIGINRILIKNLYQRITINARDISSVSLLSREEVIQFFNKSYWPVVEAEKEMNIARWYRASKYYGMLTRFVSVPVVNSVTRSGAKSNITGFNTRVTGPAVLIQTSSHGFVFITPQDPEQYITRLRGIGVREVRPGEFMEKDLSGDGNRKMGIFSTPGGLRAYSLISFLLLTAGILAFFLFLQESSRVPEGNTELYEAEIPVLNNEEINFMNGRWENDSLFYFVVKDSELEDIEKEGEITVGMIRRMVFPAVWKSYFSEKNVPEVPVPDEGTQSMIIMWLIGQPVYRQIGSFLTEKGEKYWLYEQRTNGMKPVFFGMISNSLDQE